MPRAFLKVGNSRILLWDGKSKKLSFDTGSFAAKKLFKNPIRFSELIFVSVVPRVSRDLRRECRKREILVREVGLSDFGIRPAYKKNIGMDRLLNLFSGVQFTKENFVVIDFGTATTVDFFDASRACHLGGWISAGPHLVARALHEKTAKLPYVEPRGIKKPLGSNTKESLLIGQRALMHGMILEAHRVAEGFWGRHYDVFVTGGGAPLVPKAQGRLVRDLGLHGLKRLSEKR